MNLIKHNQEELLAMAREKMQNLTSNDGYILIIIEEGEINVTTSMSLEAEYDTIHSLNDQLAKYITNKTNK